MHLRDRGGDGKTKPRAFRAYSIANEALSDAGTLALGHTPASIAYQYHGAIFRFRRDSDADRMGTMFDLI